MKLFIISLFFLSHNLQALTSEATAKESSTKQDQALPETNQNLADLEQTQPEEIQNQTKAQKASQNSSQKNLKEKTLINKAPEKQSITTQNQNLVDLEQIQQETVQTPTKQIATDESLEIQTETSETQKTNLNSQTENNPTQQNTYKINEKDNFELQTETKNQENMKLKGTLNKKNNLEKVINFFNNSPSQINSQIRKLFIKNKKSSKTSLFKKDKLNKESSEKALSKGNQLVADKVIEDTSIKNISSKDNSTELNSSSKKWALDVKNSLLFQHNDLLKAQDNFSVSIPYTELDINYKLSEKLFFEVEFDLSYKNRSLGIKIDDLFFKYSENSLLIPFSLQWGKFRMNYIKSNSKLFHKKTLTHEFLFPYGDRALGAGLEINLTDSLSVLTGWQAYHNKRETDGFQSLKPSSAISSYLLYKKNQKNLFVGYLQQSLFLEGELSAYGTGADLSHFYKDWFFKFKTELWQIKTTEPSVDIISYYLFPYIKWNSLIGVGIVLGSSQESLLDNNQALQFESLIKLDLYFTQYSYFSIERIQEYSSIYKKNLWNFSIKSDFSL